VDNAVAFKCRWKGHSVDRCCRDVAEELSSREAGKISATQIDDRIHRHRSSNAVKGSLKVAAAQSFRRDGCRKGIADSEGS